MVPETGEADGISYAYTYQGYESTINSISIRCPRLRPHLRDGSFPAGWMHQLHEGIAENHPGNIPALSKTLRAGLRNSWWETAVKMGDSLITESKNQLTQRGKSSDFP